MVPATPLAALTVPHHAPIFGCEAGSCEADPGVLLWAEWPARLPRRVDASGNRLTSQHPWPILLMAHLPRVERATTSSACGRRQPLRGSSPPLLSHSARICLRR